MIFIDWVFVGDAVVAYCTKAALLGIREGNEIGWSSEMHSPQSFTDWASAPISCGDFDKRAVMCNCVVAHE